MKSSLAPGNTTLRDREAFGKKMANIGKKWFGLEEKIKSYIPKFGGLRAAREIIKQEKRTKPTPKQYGETMVKTLKKRKQMYEDIDKYY